MTKDNKIEIIKPSLPTGGGSLQSIGESVSADEFTGMASLSIPIPTSPCRGFEPELSLGYSSGAGNGVFGLGFNLSTPSIQRKTDSRIPTYDRNDIFILSSEDSLVPLNGSVRESLDGISYEVIAYRPRAEDLFAKIEQWINQADNTSFWRVISTENVTSLFGSQPGTRICDPGDTNGTKIFQWLLDETFDAKGNHVLYEYKPEDDGNVPDTLSEQNRQQSANKYLAKIKYGRYPAKPPGVKGALQEFQWHFEVVFDYGEYDSDPSNQNPYTPVRQWACRQDSFSQYRAGFEIRTHRLCRRVLMFHRFEEEFGSNPVLVHATRFHYEENPTASLLTRVDSVGYLFRAGQPYETLSLPPVEFRYTPFQPSAQDFRQLLGQDGASLPALERYPTYTLVDLFGEGVPGVLYTDESATLYAEPHAVVDEKGASADVRYGRPQNLPAVPNEENLNDAQHILTDVDGSGRMALLVAKGGGAGFYASNPDHTWQSFQPFASFPTDYYDAKRQLVDVTGDGLADVLSFEQRRVTVYPSKGTRGYGPLLMSDTRGDLPIPVQDTVSSAVRFTDVFGSGQQHLVRISDGMVECWPSLGYGRFGEPVILDDAPRFRGTADMSRLYLADIDGSGTADIIYAYPDRVEIFFNRSGNFFSDPLIILLPSVLDRLDQLQFADVYGSGATCMVFSELHPEPRHWCYDFSAGVKPNLLSEMSNNVGVRTKISYRSSTSFYLQDKQDGRAWITSLPFPVQVIERIETSDSISNTELVSTFAYRHGFYDGAEHEFRGFGLVERLDAETLEAEARKEQPSEEAGAPLYVPPVLTKTWYHMGDWRRDAILSGRFAEEYWQQDEKSFQSPTNDLTWEDGTLDSETLRQAYRTFKGSILRQEVYGLDGTALQNNPYSVSESGYSIKLLQPLGENPYAVFHAHLRETISYDYERNPLDPRVSHEFVLKVDDDGNVLRSCALGYGRRSLTGDELPEQLALRGTAEEYSYLSQSGRDFHLLGAPLDEKSYELVGLTLPPGLDCFTADYLNTYLDRALQASTLRLMGWTRFYYWSPVERKPCPFGQMTPEGLTARIEQAALDAEATAQVFDGALTKDALQNLLSPQGGYYLDQGYWWNPGLTESYNDADKYFLSVSTTDQFGSVTLYEYDPYNLLLVRSTDALKNSVAVSKIDYLTLHPRELLDVNQNISEGLFDPLGTMIVTSYHGSENGQPVGFKPLQDYQAQGTPTTDDVVSNPQKYLQGATNFYCYDLFSWMGQVKVSDLASLHVDANALWNNLVAGGYITPEGAILQAFRDLSSASALQLDAAFGVKLDDIYQLLQARPHLIPTNSVQLMAEDYPGSVDAAPIHAKVVYSDGLGREQQSLVNVEPGLAYLVNPDGSVSQKPTDDRWLATGRVLYNNKGKPVKKYEPYFIATHKYVDNPTLKKFGTSPTLHYDSLTRLIRTDLPRGFFTRTEFSPWDEIVFDEDDTLKDSPYYQQCFGAGGMCVPPQLSQQSPAVKWECEALEKASLFHNTPQRRVFDNLGQVVRVIDKTEGLVSEQTFTTIGLTGTESKALFQELEDSNVVDYRGALTPDYDPAELQLSDAFAAHRDGIISTLERVRSDGVLHTSYIEYDIQGRELSSADPRLYSAGKENYRTTYAIDGQALKTISVDAGTHWQLKDASGSPLYSRDSRKTEITYQYDALGRLSAMLVKGGDGASPLNQIVERRIYGDSLDAQGNPVLAHPEAHNLRDRLYKHFDQAGLAFTGDYTMQGLPLDTNRQLTLNYKQEANWNDISEQSLTNLMQPTVYKSLYKYNALGRVLSETDADGNILEPAYLLSGLLNQIRMRRSSLDETQTVYVQSIEYNARGQRTRVSYGNGVTTDYTYDPDTFRLSAISSRRTGDGFVLQDLSYTYDPVGNITHLTDNAFPTVFNNQQQIKPDSDYTYDALYRLLEGTGREHTAMTAQHERQGGYGGDVFWNLSQSHINDAQQLRNYSRRFSYDDAGNLTQVRHITSPTASSFTKSMTVSDSSNRAVESELTDQPAQVDKYFDPSGNQTLSVGISGLLWNYRNNISSVVVVERESSPSDAEYYVYDSSGARLRKISESFSGNGSGIRTEETIYLGSLEIKKISRGATLNEERHSRRVMDLNKCVATRIDWVCGAPPNGVTNPQIRYQLDDLIGSSLLELDVQGKIISYEIYYPYGGTALIAGNSLQEVQLKQYRYSGKERDTLTGFYYYGARYYAPWLCRWMSADPAGAVDGLNLYAFVGNSPIDRKDFDGLNGKGKGKGKGKKSGKSKAGIQKPKGIVTTNKKKKGAVLTKAAGLVKAIVSASGSGSSFSSRELAEKAVLYHYAADRVKRARGTPDINIEFDASQIIRDIKFLKNRNAFSSQTKKDVHQLTQGTDYAQYSKSEKGNVSGNDFRHIKSNAHTKADIKKMFVGQRGTDVLQHLVDQGYLSPSSKISDLTVGIYRRYREEADNPKNLPPGAGSDNQRIGRISDRIAKIALTGRAAFEKGDKQIHDSELLGHLGMQSLQLENYDELLSVLTQLIYDPPQHEKKEVYFNSMQEAIDQVRFSYAKP